MSHEMTPGIHEEYPLEPLGFVLSVRARGIIRRHGLKTIGELTAWLDHVDVVAEPNYGRGTHAHLLSILQRVRTEGPNRVLFGRDAEPSTASELVESLTVNLPDAWALALVLYRDGRKLREIARIWDPPVTRQRIDQTLRTTIALARQSAFGPVARRILAPAQRLLDAGGGIALFDSCRRLAGASVRREFLVCAQLAGVDWRYPRLPGPGKRRPNLVLACPTLKLMQWRGKLAKVIRAALRNSREVESVRAALKLQGIAFADPVEEARFLKLLFGVEAKKGVYSKPPLTRGERYYQVIRDAEGPLTLNEIVEILVAAGIDSPPRRAGVHRILTRHAKVFRAGTHTWVHERNLAVSLEELARVRDLCLAGVPGNGRLVSVGDLVRRVPNFPAGLSEFTVRDAMVLSGQVVAPNKSLKVRRKRSSALE